jgi:hypothetical protein
MPGRFPRLSRLVTRILEIVGAGCASAYAAVLLGNAHEPPRPTEPVAVVRLAPADEEMIRHVREESLALAEQLRSASDARNAAAPLPAAAIPAAPATAAPTAKTAKPAAAAAPVRREQKPSGATTTELRPKPGEPTTIANAAVSPRSEPARLPAGAAAASDTRDGRIGSVTAAPGESGSSLPQTQAPSTQVPSRLWPAAASSVRDAPRPPLGVGPFLSSSM